MQVSAESLLYAEHSRKCRLDSKGIQAEIAQLVEHNLAKVGVAGPSPVFRSIYLLIRLLFFIFIRESESFIILEKQ